MSRGTTASKRTALLAAVLASLCCAALAVGDDTTLPDTDVTPNAHKQQDYWHQVAGARFPDAAVPADSPTPFDVDLFTVAFVDRSHGFAGGSVKAPCGSIPVIYRYLLSKTGEGGWSEQYRGTCDAPGYVGALAWRSDGKTAVAVGGTGTYPRREPADGSDPAGSARAWLYRDGAWSEITDLPAGMRGLTALAFDPRKSTDFGAAGGFAQIWNWSDGQFSKALDESSPVVSGVNLNAGPTDTLHFRVRQLAFTGTGVHQAYGVTAGCCAGNQAQNVPALLAFDGTSWFVRPMPLLSVFGFAPNTQGVNDDPVMPDSFYGLMATAGRVSLIATPGGEDEPLDRPSEISQAYCVGPKGELEFESADAAQAVDALHAANIGSARLLAGDGDVLASELDPYRGTGGSPGTMPTISGGPSDVAHPALNTCALQLQGYTGDSVPDWVVGESESSVTADGSGHQALAVGTGLRPTLTPGTVKPPDPARPGNVAVPTQAGVEAYLRSEQFLLPSYTLNAIAVFPGSDDGWAVGDRGAIMQLGDTSTQTLAAPDPAPAALGAPDVATAPDTSAYDALAAPPAGSPGIVPPLASRPVESPGRPVMVPGGSPEPRPLVRAPIEDVQKVVMSRDGSEGWALGPTEEAMRGAQGGRLSLFHYVHGRWSRCDRDGVAGQLPADPACASLAGLAKYRLAGGTSETTLRILDAARVPLERDGDPTNDDEFEVVAIGTPYNPAPGAPAEPAIMRYRDGRWSMEPQAERSAIPGWTQEYGDNPLSAIVFTAPDDGWILGGTGGQSDDYHLYRYDGTGWIDCRQATDRCGSPPGFQVADNTSQDGDRINGMVASGDRVWIYGHRLGGDGHHYPMILSHDRGGSWAGAFDPAYGDGRTNGGGAATGNVQALAARALPGGGYDAFAAGTFGATSTIAPVLAKRVGTPPTSTLLELRDGQWVPGSDAGALRDYASDTENRRTTHEVEPLTDLIAFMTPDGRRFVAQKQTGRLLTYDTAHGRWELVPAGRPYAVGGEGGSVTGDGVAGEIEALAGDGGDGLWLATAVLGDRVVSFLHNTAHPREPVFSEVPQPLRDPASTFTGLAARPDGSLWASATSGVLYRYTRATGWDSVQIRGWDPGRLVTRPSEVFAVAVAPGGVGVAVGHGGRIADLDGDRVVLDENAAKPAPAGTTHDLRAVAVAPDGSAMAGGDHLGLVARVGTGPFQRIASPATAPGATITGVSMPTADHAWLTTDNGLVFAGTRSGADWTWAEENDLPEDNLAGQSADGTPATLRAIAVATDGHGFAVGDRGVVLARSAAGGWHRVDTGLLDDLTSVALPVGGGAGALVGGHNGLVLTLDGSRFEIARPADWFGAQFRELTGPVVGLAAVPGTRTGQVEAWALTAGRAGAPRSADTQLLSGGVNTETNNALNQLWHYTSDPDDLATDPSGRAMPLPDAPASRPDELRFAVFGNTGCVSAPGDVCAAANATTADYEVLARRVVEQIAASAHTPGGPVAALFTGDAVGPTSLPGSSAAESAAGRGNIDVNGPIKLRRWTEQVAGPLANAGVPLLGAIGARDLSDAAACTPIYPGPHCTVTLGGTSVPDAQNAVSVGENLMWRTAMAEQAAPWGSGTAPGALRLMPVPESKTADAPGGGAHTHYAVDLVRDDTAVARVVVVDTSLSSLQGGDAVQNPVGGAGGQLTWLRQMLCSAGDGCTRGAHEPAVVVSTTPSYSYGPSQASQAETDATTFEQAILQGGASAVVSGRLGWNGLYYALAPGLHDPQPGGAFPDAPPGDSSGASRGSDVSADRVAAALQGAAAPGVASSITGAVPFVVSGTAGHPLDDVNGAASAGYWHGYAVVRVRPGDQTIVEERPVFDWLEVSGARHVLTPGQHMTLHGVGREPAGISTAVGFNTEPVPQVARFDTIDGPAITHRYDLLEADPQRPFVPRRDASGQYVPLDPSVATIDPQSGRVIAGRASHPRVYAIALLSVGDKAATYPIVFEPRRSYTAPRLRLSVPPPVPPVRVLSFGATSLQAPTTAPPASTPPPINATLQLPAPPGLPSMPSATPQPIAPAVPPSPPAPPGGQHGLPLDLSITPAGISVPPTPGVTAQPAPPIQPSPPSGARREAKQRQAATAKSEEGQAQGKDAGIDLATGKDMPGGAAFTRLAPQAQPSAWVTGLEWGGGIAAMALALALGLTGVRPRRRPPVVPAPAWQRRR